MRRRRRPERKCLPRNRNERRLCNEESEEQQQGGLQVHTRVKERTRERSKSADSTVPIRAEQRVEVAGVDCGPRTADRAAVVPLHRTVGGASVMSTVCTAVPPEQCNG